MMMMMMMAEVVRTTDDVSTLEGLAAHESENHAL